MRHWIVCAKGKGKKTRSHMQCTDVCQVKCQDKCDAFYAASKCGDCVCCMPTSESAGDFIGSFPDQFECALDCKHFPWNAHLCNDFCNQVVTGE
jgi:hypothetical protein